MTSERKSSSNRRNASRSTGPKSLDGKRRVAGNAVKHGLTGALPQEDVLAWYRAILGDEDAVIDPLDMHPRSRAVLELAEACMQLQRVRRAEEQFLLDLALEAQPVSVEGVKTRRDRPVDERTAEFLSQVRGEATMGSARRTDDAAGQDVKRHKSLIRYKNEAESRRRRALRDLETVVRR